MDDFFDFTIYDIPETKTGTILGIDKNKNHTITIILINDEYNDEQAEFLSKIISSIGYDLNIDCKLRAFDKSDKINIAEIHNLDNTPTILSFGINKNQFKLQCEIKPKQWMHFNSFSFILSHSLIELNKNIKLKREFWLELQKQFKA